MKTVRFSGLVSIACLLLLLAGCDGALPSLPKLPVSVEELPSSIDDLPGGLDDLPGIPAALRELPGLVEELGLPDISQIANLPGIEDLPIMRGTPGAIVYNGPTERRIAVGETIPGTQISLIGLDGELAEFQIDGLRSVRAVGDSLDFDGPWPGIDGVSYNLRLRIYRVGGDSVRAAGVHQLVIHGIAPVETSVNLEGHIMKFPFTDGLDSGQTIAGTTLGFAAGDEKGARIIGVPEGDYPYRKVGDSLRWQGLERPDIAVDYRIRMLYYGESDARVGGTVSVALPTH